MADIWNITHCMVRVFSGMVQARGVVLPVADACAHLCVELENGEVIVGQHRFTGKTAGPVTSPILDMWLTSSLDDPAPVARLLKASAERWDLERCK